MKTSSQLQSEIDDLKKEIKKIRENKELDALKKEKFIAKISKKIEWIKPLMTYLEGNPSEGFQKAELERMENLIYKIDEGYSNWASYNPMKKDQKEAAHLSKYRTEMGRSEYVNFAKNLRYILS